MYWQNKWVWFNLLIVTQIEKGYKEVAKTTITHVPSCLAVRYQPLGLLLDHEDCCKFLFSLTQTHIFRVFV